ncbi:hypothetical protein ABXR97_14510 [Acinetobacter seifertii]|uniref:hypothetical protein n=1 Tax=Acinetobacter seifertii TaxID=1530123 RepID=UPI003F727A15
MNIEWATRTDDMDCCEYEISICPVCTPVETTEDPCECLCGCTDPVKRPDLISDITMVSDDAWLDDKKFKLVKITNDTPPHCTPVTYWQEPDAWVFRVDESQYKQLKLKVYSLPKTLKAKDELLLPDQYWRALKLSLAVEIAPMFGTDPSLTLLKNQDNALDLLKSSNSVPAFSTNDLRVGVRHYDWHHY